MVLPGLALELLNPHDNTPLLCTNQSICIHKNPPLKKVARP